LKKLAVLLVVTIVMVFLYGRIDYTIAPYNTWDLASYRVMADAAPRIAAEVCQPPAYRLLGPYLAGLLPLPDPAAFYLLSVLASIALVLLAYRLFVELGLTPVVAVLTVVLFTFNRFWFGLTIWNFFQLNDLLSLIWIVLSFLAMFRRRWGLFGAVLLLGAFTRETALLMIPVAFVYLWERKELRGQWLRLALAAVPAVIAFVLIRALVPAPCGKSLLTQLAAHSASILSPEKIFRLTIYSYAPFSLLPLVFFGTTLAYFKQRPHAFTLLALVFLSTLFGLSFDERLMAPAFVALYALIGLVMQQAVDDGRAGVPLLVAAVAGAFLASLHHTVARFPLPGREWTLVLSMGSLVVVTAIALIYRLRRGQPAQPGAARRETHPSNEAGKDL
jgi:hypothetical protein